VAGLLDGEGMSIKPEGFDLLHSRGGISHRLREGDEKWKPLGIGPGGEEG
jgi:lysine 2,3-aminomutase